MPEHNGPDLLEDREIPKYDYISYMENFLKGGATESPNSEEVNGVGK